MTKLSAMRCLQDKMLSVFKPFGKVRCDGDLVGKEYAKYVHALKLINGDIDGLILLRVGKYCRMWFWGSLSIKKYAHLTYIQNHTYSL